MTNTTNYLDLTQGVQVPNYDDTPLKDFELTAYGVDLSGLNNLTLYITVSDYQDVKITVTDVDTLLDKVSYHDNDIRYTMENLYMENYDEASYLPDAGEYLELLIQDWLNDYERYELVDLKEEFKDCLKVVKAE